MGATRDDFLKYPRTPHLFAARGTDDDKRLNQHESEAFISDPSLIVEEKLDGTNVGIHFTSAGRLVLQCRGHEITSGMHYIPQEDYRCTVTMMAGVPGVGKDTWLRQHHPELPTVSLDELRHDLDIDPTDNQGAVIQAAREACRQLLRDRRDFAFNATNTMKLTRQRWLNLFAEYGARIELIYLEPALETIHQQNARRPRPVPRAIIEKLVDKLEPPTADEAHVVRLLDL